jgi:hypothetical protein|tara:strand:- start:3103 stop:6450 length:3348 start_codon:yes stop_codon:yes gene_type:complete
MAPKKETRQFKVGTIGVARSSRAGAIVGEALADSANVMSKIFYKRAAENAERRGIESVGRLTDQEVLALDPATGLPEAYKAPKGFGRIASNARRKALATRFETEIDVELNEKAKEFRVKYRNSPEAFKKAMLDYTAEMMNVEQSSIFTQAIENKGTNTANNVYAALQLEALAEHDKDMANANAFANKEYLIGLQYAYKVNKKELIDKLTAKINERNQTDLDAEYIRSSDLLPLPKLKEIAKSKGIIERTLQNSNLTINEIRQLSLAVASGDHNLIPDKKELEDLVWVIFMNDDRPSVMNAIQEFTLPILATAEKNQLFQSSVERIKKITEAAIISPQYLQSEIRNATDSELTGLLANISLSYTNNMFARNNAVGTGIPIEDANANLLRDEKFAKGAADAVIGKIVAEADFDDFRDIETYLAGRNPELLAKIKSQNPSVGNMLQSLLKFEDDLGMDGSDFTGKLVTAMNGITDVKRHNQIKEQYNNSVLIEDKIKNTVDILTEGNNYTNVGQDLIDEIRSADINDEQQRALLLQLDAKFGNDFVRQVYSGVNSEGLLAALDFYAKNGKERPTDTGVPSPLSDAQKGMLDAARKHLGQAALNTASNTKKISIGEQLEAAKVEAERIATLEGAVTGTTENKEKNRLIVGDYFEGNIPEGYKDLADFIANPNIPLTEENFEKIQNFTMELQKYHKVPPQAIINVLKQAASQGGFAKPNRSLSRVLRFYRAIGNPKNPVTGVSFPSFGLDAALTKEEKAVLDALVIAEMDIDPALDDRARDAALTTVAKDTLRIMTDDNFRSLFLSSLPLDDGTASPNAIAYVYRELKITDTETAERVAAGLRAGFATAQATGETFNPQKISQDVLKATAKEDVRVRTFGTSSDLSPFALDITTEGNGDDFALWSRMELGRVLKREGVVTPEGFIEGKEISQVNFVAVGYDTQTKGQAYALVDENNVAYQMETIGEDGEAVNHAVFVSTKDPMFIKYLANKQEILEEEAEREAREKSIKNAQKEEPVSPEIITRVTKASEQTPEAKTVFQTILNEVYTDVKKSQRYQQEKYIEAYEALFEQDPTTLSNSDRRKFAGRLLVELKKEAKRNNKDIMDEEYKSIRDMLLEFQR